jgi:hypothetical protein
MGFTSQNVTQCQLDPLPNKFIWNQEAINHYIQNSNSIESKNKFDVLLQSNFTDSDKTVESGKGVQLTLSNILRCKTH